MEGRAPPLLALWSVLLVGFFILSAVPSKGSMDDGILFSDEDGTLIELGAPDFDIESERID
jgi:hypothetical protein